MRRLAIVAILLTGHYGLDLVPSVHSVESLTGGKHLLKTERDIAIFHKRLKGIESAQLQDLAIRGAAIEDLDFLQNVVSIDRLSIAENSNLVAVRGLSKLERIGERLIVAQNRPLPGYIF